MPSTLLWTGSAGYSGLTGVSTAADINDAVVSASGILSIPTLASPSGGPLTLILWFANTDVVRPFGLFSSYGFFATFRGRQLATTSAFPSAGSIYTPQNNVTTGLVVNRAWCECLWEMATDISLGGSIDLYAIIGLNTSTITGMLYAMVVDFGYASGYVPRVRIDQSFETSGLHEGDITAINSRMNPATADILVFNVLFGTAISSPSIGSYSPSLTPLYSDSTSYNGASFTYNAIVSATPLLPNIYAGLDSSVAWFYSPPHYDFVNSWVTATRNTRALSVAWEPILGSLVTPVTSARSYAQIIG